MLAELIPANCNWLCTGHEVFPAMLAAINAAQRSICLETYIYSADSLGEKFRGALIRARERGARVQVLYDALGSMSLPASFWDPLRKTGGEVRQFNPLVLNRFGVRDHRKMLICDERVAFIGGFNIAMEYDGDGIKTGWRDLGLKLEGSLAGELKHAFEEMFERADFVHNGLKRLKNYKAKKTVAAPHEQVLLSGPGRGRSPIKHALRRDLARAQNVQIIVAYFLPTWRIRRSILRVAQRGGRVQLILAGKSDVLLSQLAGQSLYRRFLRAGVQIHEYAPQILHAKLILIDDVVYVGSSNLDQRSLNINYELMVRFENKEMAAEARDVFASTLKHCREITVEDWVKSRSVWQRIKQRWAYLLLVRFDPLIARWRWRTVPD
jgi:cardiolipin synthase A/B